MKKLLSLFLLCFGGITISVMLTACGNENNSRNLSDGNSVTELSNPQSGEEANAQNGEETNIQNGEETSEQSGEETSTQGGDTEMTGKIIDLSTGSPKIYEEEDFPEAMQILSTEGKLLEEYNTVEKNAEEFFDAESKIRSAVLVEGGSLYFGNEACEFFAVDITTGKERWKYTTDDAVLTRPVFSGGKVIFNAGNSLYILNAEDGTEMAKVTYNFDSAEKSRRLSQTSYSYNDSRTAVADGKAYYGANNGDIIAVDISTGEITEVFKAEKPGAAGSGININNGKLYWVDYSGTLCCINLADNTVVFRTEIIDRIFAPMLIEGSKIYIAGRKGMLYCIDAESGGVLWRSYSEDPTTWFSGGCAVIGDNIYSGTSDEHTVVSFHKETGEFSRIYETVQNAYNAPLMNGENLIIAATDVYSLKKTVIMEFDTVNHTKLWEAKLDDGVLSSPALYEGYVYFGSDSGNIYRVKLD